jgi:hypothetical protein
MQKNIVVGGVVVALAVILGVVVYKTLGSEKAEKEEE